MPSRGIKSGVFHGKAYSSRRKAFLVIRPSYQIVLQLLFMQRKTLLVSTNNKCNCLQLKPFANNRTLGECICNRRRRRQKGLSSLSAPLLACLHADAAAAAPNLWHSGFCCFSCAEHQKSVNFHFKCHHFGVISVYLVSTRLVVVDGVPGEMEIYRPSSSVSWLQLQPTMWRVSKVDKGQLSSLTLEFLYWTPVY